MGKTATIAVIGDIGQFEMLDKSGERIQVNGIMREDVIAQVTRLAKEVDVLIVDVGGNGGAVPEAKAIRGFLKSIQPRYEVITRQVGDIRSAHTIVFTSGSKRKAAKGINPATGKPFHLMIHAPLIPMTGGNADQLSQDVAGLRATEEEFAAMYSEDTGISLEAIKPLMKADTFFDADKAVDLKIATETYTALNQAAYSTMATKKKSAGILAALASALGIDLETGETKVAAAPPAELVGKAVMVDGKAAPDGVYTVVGGVVTLLAAPAEEQADNPAAAGTPAASKAPAQPAAVLSKADVLALIKEANKGKKDPDEDEGDDDLTPKEKKMIAMLGEAMGGAVQGQVAGVKAGIKTSHVPVGFKPENKAEDAKEWDRSFKANEHVAMKRDDPEKWTRLFYAKYGRMPN